MFFSYCGLGSCLRDFSGHTDMVVGFSLRCLDTPIAVNTRDGNVDHFEANDTSSYALADALIVSVSDDNTARVFVFNSSEISSQRIA